MSKSAMIDTEHLVQIDYSLVGVNAALAIEKGLAEADWYQCPVPRETMRKLLERRDGPAIRHTFLWFFLLFMTAAATVKLWHTWWAVLPYLIYAVLYATPADSRWHESGHGTAFKTDWMNSLLYEISSFMIVRESVVWRWSHTRHHSDTIIVGRDPEISIKRPPSIMGTLAKFFALPVYPSYFKHLLLHSFGHMTAEEKTFIPATEFHKVYRIARIHLLIYIATVCMCVYTHSILPLLLVGFPDFFGTWLGVLYGITQHAGLAEECSRPPTQLPNRLHEPDPSLPVLEHELSR